MIVIIKYETLSPNETKEVHGVYESIKAFEDNALGIQKHKFFNEYFDHKYTYVIQEHMVVTENKDDTLSYSLSTGSVKYFLGSTEVGFNNLKETKYCLKYDNFKSLINGIKDEVRNKSLNAQVGSTLENNIRQIYTFSF